MCVKTSHIEYIYKMQIVKYNYTSKLKFFDSWRSVYVTL